MVSDATKEEFWACTLTKESPNYVFDPKEGSEEDVEHKLQINTACLGDKAKPGERNLVCVTTEDDSGKKITSNLLSLKLGLSECCSIDVGFRNTTTFTLKSGTGPVSLAGVHLQALPMDFESDEEESEEEEVGLQNGSEKKAVITESKQAPVKEEAKPTPKPSAQEVKASDVKPVVKDTKQVSSDIKPVVKDEKQVPQDIKPASQGTKPTEKQGKRGQGDAPQNEPPQKKKKDAEEESEEADEDEDEDEDEDDDEDVDEEGESDDEEMPSLLDGEAEEASEDEDSEAEDEEGSDEDEDDDGEEISDDDEELETEEEEEVAKPPAKGKSGKAPPAKVDVKPKEQKQTPAKPAANKAQGKQTGPKTPKAEESSQQKEKKPKTPGEGGPKKTVDEIKAILLKSPNMPKKVDKFRNFLSNNFKLTDTPTQDELWTYVQNNKK